MAEHALVIRGILIAVAIGFSILPFARSFSVDFWYVVVLLIGGSVGAIELLGRYLYAPMRAVLTPSGFSYIIVNMGASAAAFYIIGPHGFKVFPLSGAPPSDLDTLKAVLLAGFGALAFMRSSIFKLRVGDSEIGVGPVAILDTLLLVADRGVDRREAILRAREVTKFLQGANPVKGSKLLTSYCLGLMQNVSTEEKKRIQDSVKVIASEDAYEAEIRLDLIALELSKIVGPTVLEAAILALGNRLTSVESGPVPVSASPTLGELRNAVEQAKVEAKPLPTTPRESKPADTKPADVAEPLEDKKAAGA